MAFQPLQKVASTPRAATPAVTISPSGQVRLNRLCLEVMTAQHVSLAYDDESEQLLIKSEPKPNANTFELKRMSDSKIGYFSASPTLRAAGIPLGIVCAAQINGKGAVVVDIGNARASVRRGPRKPKAEQANLFEPEELEEA